MSQTTEHFNQPQNTSVINVMSSFKWYTLWAEMDSVMWLILSRAHTGIRTHVRGLRRGE